MDSLPRGRAWEARKTSPAATGVGSRDRGFTLLETLIALAIAATVLTAVYRLNLQSIAMADRAGSATTAALLAQERMTQLILEEEQGDTGLPQGDFGNLFPGWRWQAEMTAVADRLLNPEGHRMVRIDLTVHRQGWPSAYRLRRYQLFHEDR